MISSTCKGNLSKAQDIIIITFRTTFFTFETDVIYYHCYLGRPNGPPDLYMYTLGITLKSIIPHMKSHTFEIAFHKRPTRHQNPTLFIVKSDN